jgi:hypothetical protein
MASVSLQFGSRRGRKRAALRDVLCLPIDSLFVNTQSSSSSLLSPSVGRSLTRVGRAHKLLVLSIKTRMHTQTLLVLSLKKFKQFFCVYSRSRWKLQELMAPEEQKKVGGGGGYIQSKKRREFPSSHTPPSSRTLPDPSSLLLSPLPLTHVDPFVTGQGVALADHLLNTSSHSPPLKRRVRGSVLAVTCWSPCAQRRCYPTGRCTYRPSLTS